MTIFHVSTFVVKLEKQSEFTQLLQRLLKYINKNKMTYKELKSLKFFTQMYGGIHGSYVELAEYDNLVDGEKLETKLLEDEVFMKLYQKLMASLEPNTYSVSVWNAIN